EGCPLRTLIACGVLDHVVELGAPAEWPAQATVDILADVLHVVASRILLSRIALRFNRLSFPILTVDAEPEIEEGLQSVAPRARRLAHRYSSSNSAAISGASASRTI